MSWHPCPSGGTTVRASLQQIQEVPSGMERPLLPSGGCSSNTSNGGSHSLPALLPHIPVGASRAHIPNKLLACQGSETPGPDPVDQVTLGEGIWQPTPVFSLDTMDRGAWLSSPWNANEARTQLKDQQNHLHTNFISGSAWR